MYVQIHWITASFLHRGCINYTNFSLLLPYDYTYFKKVWETRRGIVLLAIGSLSYKRTLLSGMAVRGFEGGDFTAVII